jgi:hypothetical protein
MLPLILKGNNLPSTSFMTGHGTVNTFAFINEEGGIHTSPVPIGEMQSSLDLTFYRRDLEPLRFYEDLELLAHFLIV